MRVGILADDAENETSGPGNIMFNIIQELKEREDIEILLVHTSDSEHRVYEDVEDLVVSPNPLRGGMRLREEDIDVFHLNCISTKESYLYPLLLESSFIATQAGDLHFAEPSLYPHPITKLYRKRGAQKILSRFFDRIFVLSSSQKQVMGRAGIPEGKLVVTPPGIREGFYSSETGGEHLLHVSNLAPKKNPETLLKAFNEFKKQEEIPIRIAGSNWSRELVEKYVDQEYVDDVVLEGKVGRERLKKLYSEAKLLVAPTRHETFGLTAVEAMASGTPVVSSNVYSVPEVVGDAGILVEDPEDYKGFADAMQELVEDEQLREELSEAGRQRASRFNWEKTADKIVKEYRQLNT